MMAEKWIPVIVELDSIQYDCYAFQRMEYLRLSNVRSMEVIDASEGGVCIRLHMQDGIEQDERGADVRRVIADHTAQDEAARPLRFSNWSRAYAYVDSLSAMFPRSWPAETVKFGDLKTRTTG